MSHQKRLTVNEVDPGALLMAICAINVWNRVAISTHQALPERDDATKHGRQPDLRHK